MKSKTSQCKNNGLRPSGPHAPWAPINIAIAKYLNNKYQIISSTSIDVNQKYISCFVPCPVRSLSSFHMIYRARLSQILIFLSMIHRLCVFWFVLVCSVVRPPLGERCQHSVASKHHNGSVDDEITKGKVSYRRSAQELCTNLGVTSLCNERSCAFEQQKACEWCIVLVLSKAAKKEPRP